MCGSVVDFIRSLKNVQRKEGKRPNSDKPANQLSESDAEDNAGSILCYF